MAVRRQSKAQTTHLLGSVAQGQDSSAFAALFHRYAPRIKGYLRSRGAGDDQAEELLQEVMMTLWRNASGFDRSRGRAHTWIFRIARNKYIDSIRRGRSRGEGNHIPLVAADIPFVESPAAETSHMAELVQAAVRHLPAEQRRVLELAYIHGFSATEISKNLDVPAGTVKSRLRLALKKLRHAALDE